MREFEQAQHLETGSIPLPPSSNDLPIRDPRLVMAAVQCYELLRHFSQILYIKPFCLEDFARALTLLEQTSLLSTVHVALLRTIAAETALGSTLHEALEWALLDVHTWPELLPRYIKAHADPKFDTAALDAGRFLAVHDYPQTTTAQRLTMLALLCDNVLRTKAFRKTVETGGGGNAVAVADSEDYCRKCGVGGELVLCELCPAVYHIQCMDPPLTEIPEGEWFCPDCEGAICEGAMQSVLPVEREGGPRGLLLGFDRVSRRYTFVARRVFVETEQGDITYYSCKEQLDELLAVLDGVGSAQEKRLVAALRKYYDAILRQMKWSVDSTEIAMTGSLAEAPVPYLPAASIVFDEIPAAVEGASTAFDVWIANRNAEPNLTIGNQPECSRPTTPSKHRRSSNQLPSKDSDNVVDNDAAIDADEDDDDDVAAGEANHGKRTTKMRAVHKTPGAGTVKDSNNGSGSADRFTESAESEGERKPPASHVSLQKRGNVQTAASVPCAMYMVRDSRGIWPDNCSIDILCLLLNWQVKIDACGTPLVCGPVPYGPTENAWVEAKVPSQ